ncbi:MBL fold metallo-hydrolase [Streptomyces sp. NPDC056479]|uniref:MBL fold metallo-hydrolase n=1 Tax=Streptomyces sp. NPDC056479 TaxID=3345832 RepID=UPI0036CDA7C5
MASTLNFNVFTAPEKPLVGDRPRPFGDTMAWDPMTSTLIYGDSDAVLVDTLTTEAEAEALAAWVALHHRNLTTIYITHGHLDHFAGVSVLKRHFPTARCVAAPGAVELARKQQVAFYRKLLPGRLPAVIPLPDPYNDEVLTLEGHELRIIQQGHTDAADSTSLYVPSLDLVVAGDVLYNQCHQYVAGLTPENLANWLAALDRLAALNPKVAVAGHKKPGAADTPEAIEWTKRYLTDFARLREETSGDAELFGAMTKQYPGWAAPQAWLMFGLA